MAFITGPAAVFKSISVAALLSACVAIAREPLLLFDAHVHFSAGATSAYTPEAALKILDNAGIGTAIVSSTPNDGTLLLHAAYPQRFIPFVRPYRKTRDLSSWGEERHSWYKDPDTLPFLEKELARGIYHGIGEFHVDGHEIDTPVMRGLAALAIKHGLWLMAHSDASAIEQLVGFAPGARILWAHTGMVEPAAKVAELLERYPRLYGELSYRSGVGNGLSEEWRALLLRFPDRFVYGSDTWIPSRWSQVDNLTREAQDWLATLPPEVAQGIAYRNAQRLFGPPGSVARVQ
ncbi:MAG: amidohydrolase [Limnohabitans sp.]|nr:amidohydrolase [Limnohabitans sp.]